MQWVRVSLILAAGALALVILHSGSPKSPDTGHTAPAPPQARTLPITTSPYDSIRTNLDDYSWPTDAGRLVTSTFGEYRRTHFHGGIDVSTGDLTGYRVFASRAGEVTRVRVDATGYGKILYVRHPDGYTTTYAHLRGFAPSIEQRVRKEQERLERYPVHIEFASGELPVRKGELIAYTGETGSGSPHLHFEIRDERMNGINPMLAPQLRTEDDIPPVFRKIAIVPLGARSTVNGQMHAAIIPVRLTRPRSFQFTRPLTIAGAAGIGVYVRDKGNGTRYSRGVYRHRLFVDGRLFFEVRLDRVPMQESQQIGLYFVRDLLRNGEGRFEKLFVDSGHDLPVYADEKKGSGWLSPESLPTGSHAVTILSQDFNGNTSELSGTIRLVAPPPAIVASEANGTVRFSISPPGGPPRVVVEEKNFSARRWASMDVHMLWDTVRSSGTFALPVKVPEIVRIRAATGEGPFSPPAFVVPRPQRAGTPTVRLDPEIVSSGLRVALSSDGIFTTPPVLALEEGNVRRLLPMTATDERHYWTIFTPVDTVAGKRTLVFEGTVNADPVRVVESLDVYPIVPGRNGTIVFDNGDFRLHFDSLSVYDTLYLQMKVSTIDGDRVYELLPDRSILREGLAITLRTSRPSARQAIFTRSGGDWSLLARPGNPESGLLTARLTDWLGSLALLTDNAPPLISNFRFLHRKRSETLAMFRVWDELSGVDYKELKVYIDGKFVVPEVDGEHRRVTVVAPGGLTRGSHRLQVRVQDNLGNPSFLERGFVVP
jgi:hypothetical protein